MTDRKDSGDWPYRGPALDASGRLVNKPAVKPEGPPELDEEPLELDTSHLQKADGTWTEPGAYREDVTTHRRRATAVKVIAVLAVLGVGAAVASIKIPFLHAFRLQGAARPLFVMSEPSGAEVRVNGARVGTTPYAADNRYIGKLTVELHLEGYETFSQTFEGGRDVHVAATLKKKK